MMMGLKISAASLVLFITAVILWGGIKGPKDTHKQMPGFLAIIGFFGIAGIPVGLILAIFGV